MYSEHPCFEAPKNPKEKVWKYMDFTKFVSLLEEKALFFPSITQLKENDRLEGFLNEATVQKFRAASKNTSDELKKKKDETIKNNLEFIKRGRSLLNISSFHLNKYESMGMWKLYLKSNEGVAVQTNFDNLKKSFISPDLNIHIGAVKYITNNDLVDPFNIFNLALYKRKGFEHERELRAVIMQATKSGLLVPIDINIFIEKVYVSPTAKPWILDLVKKIVGRYELKKEVIRSEMDKDPLY